MKQKVFNNNSNTNGVHGNLCHKDSENKKKVDYAIFPLSRTNPNKNQINHLNSNIYLSTPYGYVIDQIDTDSQMKYNQSFRQTKVENNSTTELPISGPYQMGVIPKESVTNENYYLRKLPFENNFKKDQQLSNQTQWLLAYTPLVPCIQMDQSIYQNVLQNDPRGGQNTRAFLYEVTPTYFER